MDNNLKIYDYIFDPTQMNGIELIALVENPAIEILAVQLSKDIPVYSFKMASEAQRVLVSPILIPDQLIYRSNIYGEPAYVRASKETIARLQEHFVSMGYQKNSNIEHQGNLIDGIVFTEQWIVQNSENDTINAYGFENVPVGSWCVKAKLSQDLWDEYITNGKVRGFSVEGMLGLQLSNNNNENNIIQTMDKNIIENMVKEIMSKMATETEQVQLADETVVVDEISGKTSGDTSEEVYVENEEVVVEDVVVDDTQTLEEKLAEKEKLVADLEAKIIELEAKISEYEAEKQDMDEYMTTMAKETPASNGIKDVPVQLAVNSQESMIDMLKRLRTN